MLKVFCWQKGTNQFLFVVRFIDEQFLAEYDCHTGIRDSGEFQDVAIIRWAPYGNPMVNLFDRTKCLSHHCISPRFSFDQLICNPFKSNPIEFQPFVKADFR